MNSNCLSEIESLPRDLFDGCRVYQPGPQYNKAVHP